MHKARGIGLMCAGAILAYSVRIGVEAASAQQLDPGISAIVSALKATLTVTSIPATVNGWTPKLANGLTTTVTQVKGSAGELGAYHCYNPNTSNQAYIQIFDVATSGGVALGSTVPALSLGLPAADGGNLEWVMGIHFANGIQVAATTTATGSTALGTSVDCNFAYK